MAWIGGLIAGAGALISSQTSAANAAGANATNIQLQREQDTWEQNMVQNQMQYNSQEADTVYQRGVADMKAAGLNPMLGYSQGGDPAPTAGIANVQAAHVDPVPAVNYGGAVNSALSAAAQKTQIDATNAQIDKTNADAANIRADTANKLADNPDTGTAGMLGVEQTQSQIKKLALDMDNLGAQFDLTTQNTGRAMQDQALQLELFPLLKRAQELDNQAKDLGMPGLRNNAAMQNSAWGKYIAPYLPSLGQGVSAVSKAATIF